MCTAQQDIATRGHEEKRKETWKVSDINRGNFLDILHLRCRRSIEGQVLYELIKTTVSIHLSSENIIAECLDGAANMSVVHKGLAGRMKDCSPFSLYVHCYGPKLNLALQGNMTEIEPL